ncbi:MAG: hypothetical protein H6R17_1416 [Proteobacteria bacterium]|nr:hypothetical protein [Pseudomonadota bacterium]
MHQPMKIPEPVSSPAMQRILGVLEKKSNMSVSDISAEAFVGVSTLACGGYIAALKKRKLIYVSGWRKVNGRFSTPLYSLGGVDDVIRPRIDDSNRDAPGMQGIVATLERYGQLTYREIARFSGLSLNTVKNSGFLDALLVQGRIHIGDWRRSSHGPMSPVYACGPGAAAPKPQSLTSAQKDSRHRSRLKIAAQGTGLSAQIASLSSSIKSAAID